MFVEIPNKRFLVGGFLDFLKNMEFIDGDGSNRSGGD